MRVSVPKLYKNGNASTMNFKNTHKKITTPIVVYADSEAINAPIDEVTPFRKPKRNSERKCVSIRAHVDFKVSGFASFSFQVMGDDAAAQFIKKLNDIRPMLVKEFTKNMPMNVTKKDIIRNTTWLACVRNVTRRLETVTQSAKSTITTTKRGTSLAQHTLIATLHYKFAIPRFPCSFTTVKGI
jgi:hypothetical protein